MSCRRAMGAAGRASFTFLSLGSQALGLMREFSFSQVVLMTFKGDSFLAITYRRVAGYVPVWWPRP